MWRIRLRDIAETYLVPCFGIFISFYGVVCLLGAKIKGASFLSWEGCIRKSIRSLVLRPRPKRSRRTHVLIFFVQSTEGRCGGPWPWGSGGTKELASMANS